MKRIVSNRGLISFIAALGFLALFAAPALAQKPGKNGTTLSAYKTIDICALPDGNWRYSGEIAVWNEGAVDTEGFTIQDCIQNKTGAGQFVDQYCIASFDPVLTVIPKGGTQLTALSTKYTIVGAPLAGYIRNRAQLTITNHSGSLGTPKGPEPKATWLETTVPACPLEGDQCGCTFTQGYWGSKPGVVWPDGFDRNAPFYLSGLTWQQILDGSVGGNGYFILAHQFIAAVLNTANGACVPSGVQDTLDLAAAWLAVNTQGTPAVKEVKDKGVVIVPAQPATGCEVAGSCGLQKDWAKILDDYNNGVYPDSPGHCSE